MLCLESAVRVSIFSCEELCAKIATFVYVTVKGKIKEKQRDRHRKKIRCDRKMLAFQYMVRKILPQFFFQEIPFLTAIHDYSKQGSHKHSL